MASDLEELIFIPAASHLSVNRPSACCRSWLEGASRTTSSAKRRDKIHWYPNQTPSGPWLRLEILIKLRKCCKQRIAKYVAYHTFVKVSMAVGYYCRQAGSIRNFEAL
ncbi:hypothetical protein XENORESO_019268 [Xenotaenia resolanae]|uniref:F-box domain-containing protein n=1 Tax=Xenotaenia resolanae TaxID=208358 RepID=A0ABV0VT38_9TELE